MRVGRRALNPWRPLCPHPQLGRSQKIKSRWHQGWKSHHDFDENEPVIHIRGGRRANEICRRHAGIPAFGQSIHRTYIPNKSQRKWSKFLAKRAFVKEDGRALPGSRLCLHHVKITGRTCSLYALVAINGRAEPPSEGQRAGAPLQLRRKSRQVKQ